jgi:tRNA 2-selenouridine synthase
VPDPTTEKTVKQLAIEVIGRHQTGKDIDVGDTPLFARVIAEQHPLIDVRAPVEFLSGSLPGAVNLPIMGDEERRQVGVCYKEAGKEEAIALGRSLVSGEKRDKRVAGWVDVISADPQTMIYCARGGLRSHIAREWIKTHSGRQVELVEGGYKAFRRYLLDHLNPGWMKSSAIVIGGRTGVGKTILINRLKNSVDLEALANHRGSSFGNHLSGQPCDADFENRLAAALIRHDCGNFRHLIVEDEGRHIGRRFLPVELVRFFATGELIVVEAPLEERVEITYDEYVVAEQILYLKAFSTIDGLRRWCSAMESGIDRIANKLGPSRHRRVKEMFSGACARQEQTGDASTHKDWIEQLLRIYYDPMYDFQLKKDTRRVIFRGSLAEVEQYLKFRDS